MSVIQPIATIVADQPSPAAVPLSHSAGYPATRKAASVVLDPRAAADRVRRPLDVTRSTLVHRDPGRGEDLPSVVRVHFALGESGELLQLAPKAALV